MKKPKPTGRDGFGILNPYGDMWTTEIFETKTAAERHLANFWCGVKNADLTKFRIVRARVKTSYRGEIDAALSSPALDMRKEQT